MLRLEDRPDGLNQKGRWERSAAGGIAALDRLTSMNVFARVAATRSFSAAARELGISQATASKHVQTLENWLGTRLLHRTTRQVGLTVAGHDFFTQATRILEDMEAARQAGHTVATLRGNLRVAIPVGFGASRLAALVLDFLNEHAELSVSITVCDRPVDLIEEGFDLAIRVWPRPTDDPGMVVQPLLLLRYVVCAAPGYLHLHGTPEVPADLARMPCLTDDHYFGKVWSFTGPGGEIEVAVKSRLKADNPMLRRVAALAGAGILLIPEILVEDDLATGRLLRVLPNYPLKTQRLDAVALAHRAVAPKVREFIAFLAERLRE